MRPLLPAVVMAPQNTCYFFVFTDQRKCLQTCEREEVAVVRAGFYGEKYEQ